MKKLLLSMMFIFAISLQASAEVDFSRTINLSGKQRMLTQKMAKESLLVALDVDKENNLANLKKTRDLFDKTLKGLKNGDESLGLVALKKPKIQSQLDTVMGLWEGYDAAISGIISAGSASEAQINSVALLNLPLLKEMNRAVKFYESEASDGDLNPALAAAINISGRQRMLTQKMSKEFLLIAKGKDADANSESLNKTVALFDNSLNGLINGDASLGLSPAPTPDLKAQLEKVQTMWLEFKAAVEAPPVPDTVQVVATKNLPLLKEMNKAVGMFEAF